MFGVYGYGLFVISPFVVGATAAYLANRRRPIGAPATMGVAMIALLIGGMALILLAFEGFICILMAAPIAAVMALLGAELGRNIAARGQEPVETSVFAFGLLPLVFAIEQALPAVAEFDTSQSIVVVAPAPSVWRALVAPGRIDERPSLPFRLGLAYATGGYVVVPGASGVRVGVLDRNCA